MLFVWKEVDILPENTDLQENSSNKLFKFGASIPYLSLKQVNLPANIGGTDGHILTDVVDCEIPLLLSKNSLKTADSQLDFVNDTITMYGRPVNLQHTSNGHYCIPLKPKQIAINSSCADNQTNVKVTLTVSEIENKTTKEKNTVALRLHKQFGHIAEPD